MIYVHSLIWELSNVEITRELTGSGESESIHRDEMEQPEIIMVLGKMTCFRGYQSKASGGKLFFFLCSNSIFLEGCINIEQFVKSEIGMEYLLSHLFHLLPRPSLHPV